MKKNIALKNIALLLILLVIQFSTLYAQQNVVSNKENLILASDTKMYIPIDSPKLSKKVRDSIKYAHHIPQIATRRSAIIPGWGQIYNGEYWKLPLVYGVLSIPSVMYVYNQGYYKKTKFAYEARFKAENGDSSDIAQIDPELTGLGIGSLQNYRNSFRRNRDYSILWFLLAWGLQVVDATVSAHLKQFNVNDDLSLQIHPTINPTSRTPALSFTFNWRETAKKSTILAR